MAWRTEHVEKTPPGWRVRTVRSGEHELRIAFPPGPRRRGRGKVIEILHPTGENPCPLAGKNPGELVIFANPGRSEKMRAARSRAARIREARTAFARNQTSESQQAVDLYTEFHGADPKEILTVQRSAAMRLDYAAIGPLFGLGLDLDPEEEIPSPDHWEEYSGAIVLRDAGIMLASNAEGSQLYAIGGVQNDFLEVAEQLGEDLTKDLLDLGPVAFAVYLDSKPPKYEQTEYMHSFEDPLPHLGFDQIKHEIFFAGGRYSVKGLWLHD